MHFIETANRNEIYEFLNVLINRLENILQSPDNHTFYRFKGLIPAIRHKKGWGKIERKGFARNELDPA